MPHVPITTLAGIASLTDCEWHTAMFQIHCHSFCSVSSSGVKCQAKIYCLNTCKYAVGKTYYVYCLVYFLLSLNSNIFHVSSFYRSRTAFEKNKTDVFRIKTHNVGPLKKLRYCASNLMWQKMPLYWQWLVKISHYDAPFSFLHGCHIYPECTASDHWQHHSLCVIVKCTSHRITAAYREDCTGTFSLISQLCCWPSKDFIQWQKVKPHLLLAVSVLLQRRMSYITGSTH